MLEDVAHRFRLIINPVIYAEVSVTHSRIEDLEAALPKTLIDREAISYEVAFLADNTNRLWHRPSSLRAATWRRGNPGPHARCCGSGLLRRFAPRNDGPWATGESEISVLV
jgi:hypothetical protein